MSYLEELRRQHAERRAMFEAKSVPDYGINLRGPIITRKPRDDIITGDKDYDDTSPGYASTYLLDAMDVEEPRKARQRRFSERRCFDELFDLLVKHHSASVIFALKSKARPKKVTVARHQFYFLARYVIKASWSEVGRRLKKDHSTVIVGLRRLCQRSCADFDVAFTLAELESELRRRCGLWEA